MVRRDERSPNAEKQPGHDDANANPGTGASGPGDPGYEGRSGVDDDGGEAGVDLEASRRAVREQGPEADPANQSDG
jgi:hypothetical protein